MIRKGDHFTYLAPSRDDANYYVALEDAKEGSAVADHYHDGTVLRAKRVYIASSVRIINRTQEDRDIQTEAETAKLDLAVEYGLQAKFNYTNALGDTHDVRLRPDEVYKDGIGNELVSGDAYDEVGDLEGYKQYRLDRINGKVVIR